MADQEVKWMKWSIRDRGALGDGVDGTCRDEILMRMGKIGEMLIRKPGGPRILEGHKAKG